MLIELFESLRARTPGRAARKLGYAREAAALAARHRRLERAWSGHVCATQNALLASAWEAANENGVGIAIGAGTLGDISLSDLTSCFGEVWLVDIAFARAARAWAARMGGRVRCVCVDITGLVDALYATPKTPPDEAIPRRLPLELPHNLAWIASVNCLAQIPLPLAAWLLRHGEDEAAVEAFGCGLMRAHTEQLSAPGVPVCLITEMEDKRFGPRGKLLDRTDYRPLLAPLLEARGAAEASRWEWRTYPPGELAGGEWETRNMSAWRW
jgi:hypothetical protein